MTVHWLLDASVFDAYHDELVQAIVAHGDKVRSLNRPKAPYTWDDLESSPLEAFPAGACVVTHADIELVCRVLADGRWTPGAFATLEHYYCSHYYKHFDRHLLNRDHVMLPFEQLASQAPALFARFGSDGHIFVRPDSPLKLFTGMVASRETFDSDLEFMAFYEFPVDSLVVVSSPKTILREWRFVIADQSVVASSQYKEAGEFIPSAASDAQALKLAEAILADGYAPDPVWVLDICQTEDQAYHLLEIGGFSFANLYECDKRAVVQAVSRIAARTAAEG